MKYLLLALLLFSPCAHAVRETGNGGDPIEMEFKKLGFELGMRLTAFYPQGMKPIDMGKFRVTVNGARVEATDDELKIGKEEKSAKNYPSEQLIQVNRGRWLSDTDPRHRVALVLHEYLGLMGNSDLKYEISNYVLGDSVLAFLIAATVNYEMQADQPHPWFCYEQVVKDLHRIANPKAAIEVDEVVKKYFVAGYQSLPGSNDEYVLSKAVYLSFEEQQGPGSFFVGMMNLTRNLWPETSKLAAMQKSATLSQKYARSGLPAACKGVLVQESNGVIHGHP